MNSRAALIRLKKIPWRLAISFFLLGVINNVLYVIILSAALDLVGAETPKSIVLLANILPSVLVKSIAPYFFDSIPYWVRVLGVVVTNVLGMGSVSLASGVSGKLGGIAMASAASGAGEITFLQMSSHYEGATALASWSSGTGGAGIIGGLMYVACTTWLRISPTRTLLASSFLPFIMALTYFVLLPLPANNGSARRHTHRKSSSHHAHGYSAIQSTDSEDSGHGQEPAETMQAQSNRSLRSHQAPPRASLTQRFSKVKPLFWPYMMPLFLVYFAEYTINQGLSPTLLFDISDMPFSQYRDVYPTYATIYQLGVFFSRSSSPLVRIKQLYLPAIGQCVLLLVVLSQALLFYIPTINVIFALILLEGIFGGLVYVNAFHKVSEDTSIVEEDREFSIGVIGVADSFGILAAALASLYLEPAVCRYQVADGRPWCRLE